MGSETAAKIVKTRHHGRRKCFVVASGVLLTFMLVMASLKTQENNNKSNLTGPTAAANNNNNNKEQPLVSILPDLATKLDDCTVMATLPPSPGKKNDNTRTTRPLWLPSFPNSLEESVHKRLVNGITGLPAGGKSFYASSRKTKLRQCFGTTETATCTNIHPIVEMSHGPDSKSRQFYHRYVLAIRNPATALPAFYNGKQIQYHGQTGQVDPDQWRHHRDLYLRDMMEGYKSVLTTWNATRSYRVGMYLVYEELMDATRGPRALQRLAALLQEAGFRVTAQTEDDFRCVWYKAVGGKEPLERFETYHYEYTDYLPGYTRHQQEYLMNELTDLVTQSKHDPELVAILTVYRDEIRDSIRIDKEWTNQTAKR